MVAAYALDALSPDEARKFERHLKTCADCRKQLVALADTAAELAFATPPQAAPELLRPRILGAARADRPRVLRPRRSRTVLATASVGGGVAALAVAAAVAWAFSLQNQLQDTRSDRDAAEHVTAVLAQRDVRLIPLKDANGSLAVAPNGQAALLVSDLPDPGKHKAYEIWVINGGEPQPAGLLASGAGRKKLALSRLVLPGTRVAISIERAGGVRHITGPELFSATNS